MQYKLWQSFFQNKWVLNNMSAFIRLFGSTAQTWLINASLPNQSAPDNKADKRLIYSAPPWFGFRVCWLWDTCVCMYMSSVCMCLPCDPGVRLKSMLKIKSSVGEEGQSFTRKIPVDALVEENTFTPFAVRVQMNYSGYVRGYNLLCINDWCEWQVIMFTDEVSY